MDNKCLIGLLIIILFASNILALGINSPYWKSNPLKMYPGQSIEVDFTLANSILEESSAKAFVTLTDSAGVAEIIGPKEFTVPPGSNYNKITIKISIPENANVGDTYEVKFSVKSVPEEAEGSVQLGIGISLICLY